MGYIQKTIEKLEAMTGKPYTRYEKHLIMLGFDAGRDKVKDVEDLGSESFYCSTKRGCLEQCDDCALTELSTPC